MTILYYVLLFVVSVAVTLGGCAIFTNAIEWLGKRLGISEGAVGSVFAAIGTTLPETSIPIIAIFFGESREEVEVGSVPSWARRSCSARWYAHIGRSSVALCTSRQADCAISSQLSGSPDGPYVFYDRIFYRLGLRLRALQAHPPHGGRHIDLFVYLLHELVLHRPAVKKAVSWSR